MTGGLRSRGLRRANFLVAVMLLPKCLACAAGYLAVAAGFGASAPEICGAVPPSGDGMVISALALMGTAGAALVVSAVPAARYFASVQSTHPKNRS